MRSLPRTRTDPLGNLTSFAYDTLGRLIQKTYPPVGGAAAVETTAYDDAHDVVAVTDAEGHATATSYDLQHRPAQIQNAARGIKAYQYDAAGNKTLESDWSDAGSPAHDTTFVYDDAERLAERDEPLGRVTTYAYDGVGNVTTETLSDTGSGGVSGFEPRACGRPTSTTPGATTGRPAARASTPSGSPGTNGTARPGFTTSRRGSMTRRWGGS